MNRIGRYEITGRLGRGAMSTVYKAKAPVTGRLVAVKILQPRNEIFAELVGGERLKDIFLEEARIMGGIQHDHVAKIIDCDTHDGQPFIALEYFAHSIGSLIGEAYRVENPSRVISAAKTQAYIVQALRGLERLHFSNIIHRDIKPFNLMLTSDDRVKIIDFGLSRVRGEEKMAIPGMQVGSPYYAAPEQGKDPSLADVRADLFSLGVLACRMLTGRLYESGSGGVHQLLANHTDLSPEWAGCIGRAVERDPGKRFASAREMRVAFSRLVPPGKERCSGGFLLESGLKAQQQKRCRTTPARVLAREIGERLGLDALLRPLDYYEQDFVVEDELILERNSRLYWQRHGAGFTLNWHQAGAYVQYLNDIRWQGCSSWRLPTLEEIRVVLTPPLHDAGCSSWPLFDPSVHWLWSSDSCSKRQAWMVDIAESFFHRLDKDGIGSVCAVSSAA